MISARENWFVKVNVWFVLATFSISGTGWASPLSGSGLSSISNQSIISIPKSLGSVEENFKGFTSKPTVIYIQDAHANPSAQKNIKAILELLSKKNGFSTVGVEGADSRINPDLLNLLPDAKINLEVSRELLEEGRLSGAELFALENNNVLVMGVDDRELYQENLSDYRRIADESAAVLPVLEKIKKELREKKKSVYDSRLIELEDRKEFSTKSPQTILSYASYLEKLSQRVLDINLVSRKSAAQYPSFVRLLVLANDKELSPKQSQQIKNELAGPALFDEMSAVEKKIYAKLLNSDIAKTYYVQSQVLELLKKTISLEAARREIETLKSVLKEVSFSELFSNDSFKNLLREALHFYEVAQSRDSNFVSKITRIAESQKLKGVVLVTGGFHREGITRQLKQNGYSYAVVSPQLSLLGENKYREIMTEKSSLVSLPLEQQYVDLPKIGAEEFLGKQEQLVLNAIRIVSVGTARQIEKNGRTVLPFWKSGVNQRLSAWLKERRKSLEGVTGIELVEINQGDRGIDSLFHLTAAEGESWNVLRSSRSGDLFETRVVASISGNSLGASYGSSQVVAEKAARVAINLGNSRSSNFSRSSKISDGTYFNRIFDATLRSFIGDPNVALTDIFGVENPKRLFEFIEGNPASAFPADLDFDSQQNILFINGTPIRIHSADIKPKDIHAFGVQYLMDFSDPDLSQESELHQSERLAELFLAPHSELKRAFIINPEQDGGETAPIIVGLNDKEGKNQIVRVATPFVQTTAHLLNLIHGSEDLKSQVVNWSDATIRQQTDQSDRQLTANHSQYFAFDFLRHRFPDIAPREIDGEIGTHFKSPIKGAHSASLIVQLKDDSEIMKKVKGKAFPKVEEVEKELAGTNARLKEIEAKFDESDYSAYLLGEKKKLSEKKKEYETIKKILDIDAKLKIADENEKKKLKEARAKELEEYKKIVIKWINKEYFKLPGILRVAAKSDNLNSLQAMAAKEMIVLDEGQSDISDDGQMELKFWISDEGQGIALRELVKTTLTEGAAKASDEQILKKIQSEFDASGKREGENVISPTPDDKDKKFVKDGEEIRLAIQGPGRIGRDLIRVLWNNPNVKLVLVNGVSDLGTLLDELKADSVYGPYPFIARIKVDKRGNKSDNEVELIDPKTGKVVQSFVTTNIRVPQNLTATKLEEVNKEFETKVISVLKGPIEQVFNSSGRDLYKLNTINDLLKRAGNRLVLLTAPKKVDEGVSKELEKVDATVVPGLNDELLDTKGPGGGIQELLQSEEQAVVSGASCTTNGAMPIAKLLQWEKFFGEKNVVGLVCTTEHALTVSQGKLLGGKAEKKGAAASVDPHMGLVPETSGAQKALVEAIKWLKGKIKVSSNRTANPTGSIIWTNIKINIDSSKPLPSKNEINQFFKNLAQNDYAGVIGVREINRSSQLIRRKESAIVDPRYTNVIINQDGKTATVKVAVWYDNELAYARRMVALAMNIAKVRRGIPIRKKEEPVNISSAVKLPGNQRLQAGSDEYKEISEKIQSHDSKSVSSPVQAPVDKIMKSVLDLFKRGDPGVLKDNERKVLDSLKIILRDIVKDPAGNSVSERIGVINPYIAEREIKDIDVKVVDLDGNSSFKTSKGNQYFGISEYNKENKKLTLYFPDVFFTPLLADPKKKTAAIQLVLMFLLQEAVGLSYDEALIALSNYNSSETQEAADGNAVLPDLLQSMLSDVMNKAKAGDQEASAYLNNIFNSQISFVMNDEIRRGLESHGRTVSDIETIQADLSRMAFLINHYISIPLGLRLKKRGDLIDYSMNFLPSPDLSQIALMRDDLNTLAPTEAMLTIKSNASVIAAANALRPVVDGYLGASSRVPNGDQAEATKELLDGIVFQETNALLSALERETMVVSAGGSVRDQARPHFKPGDKIGQGEPGYLIVNSLEKKQALFDGKNGALSVAIYADTKYALGPQLPTLYANAFVGHFSSDLNSAQLLAAKTALEVEPLNPDGDPVSVIKRWAELNNKSVGDVVVHILGVMGKRRHETQRINSLKDFSRTQEGIGLQIEEIASGTLEGALKSAWGGNGKLHVFLSTSGVSEIETVMVLAGKEHSYARFRINSLAGLSQSTDVRPEHALAFSPKEEKSLEELGGEMKTYYFTSGIVGNDVNGNFDAAIVPTTDNKVFGLPGIKKVGERSFEVSVLRVVRTEPNKLYRWIEKFRADVDAVNGIKWTPIQADVPVATAHSLGFSNIDRALEQLLKDNGFSDQAIASVASQGALSDYFQNEITQGQLEAERLRVYSKTNPKSIFTSLFGTEKSELGVTVTTTSIASAEAIATRLLSNKGSVAIVVRDSQFDDISSYAQLAEKLNLKDRLLVVEPLTYNAEDVKSIITGIMSGRRFKIQSGELVTLAKVAGKFANLGEGVKLDGYLKKHTVVLADSQILPDANRVPGIQLISVDHNKLDDASWQQYRLLASGVAMKLASAGNADALPYDIRIALKPISSGVFGFQDDFAKMLSTLWNEFQGYQMAGQSA